jgi:hypothetical protein
MDRAAVSEMLASESAKLAKDIDGYDIIIANADAQAAHYRSLRATTLAKIAALDETLTDVNAKEALEETLLAGKI